MRSGLITEVELIEFDHVITQTHTPGGTPITDGSGAVRTTRRYAVRIHTAEGLEGAYAVLWSAPPHALPQTRAMLGSLVGRSVWDREQIWDGYNRAFAKSDRIGAGAIDIALWDAAGKLTGQPIASLLGRFRDRLPVYVSTIGGGHGHGALSDPSSYRDYAAACAEAGIPGFKIHGPSTGSVRAEIDAFRATAEGSAGRMDIMTDPGKSLRTLADALALGRVCDEVAAYWWEDPVRDNAPFAHKILRQRIATPLLLTEFVRGLDLRVAVALDGGTDFLRADPELDMGITGVMKTAHAAEALGLDLEVHASGPAQRHCMAAIRNTNYYELGLLDPTTGNPLHPPVYRDDGAPDSYTEDLGAVGTDGCVAVPSGPGLGVSYDWERLLAANADRVSWR